MVRLPDDEDVVVVVEPWACPSVEPATGAISEEEDDICAAAAAAANDGFGMYPLRLYLAGRIGFDKSLGTRNCSFGAPKVAAASCLLLLLPVACADDATAVSTGIIITGATGAAPTEAVAIGVVCWLLVAFNGVIIDDEWPSTLSALDDRRADGAKDMVADWVANRGRR